MAVEPSDQRETVIFLVVFKPHKREPTTFGPTTVIGEQQHRPVACHFYGGPCPRQATIVPARGGVVDEGHRGPSTDREREVGGVHPPPPPGCGAKEVLGPDVLGGKYFGLGHISKRLPMELQGGFLADINGGSCHVQPSPAVPRVAVPESGLAVSCDRQDRGGELNTPPLYVSRAALEVHLRTIVD